MAGVLTVQDPHTESERERLAQQEIESDRRDLDSGEDDRRNPHLKCVWIVEREREKEGIELEKPHEDRDRVEKAYLLSVRDRDCKCLSPS